MVRGGGLHPLPRGLIQEPLLPNHQQIGHRRNDEPGATLDSAAVHETSRAADTMLLKKARGSPHRDMAGMASRHVSNYSGSIQSLSARPP